MEKSIARKELSRVVKGGKETVINNYSKFDFDKAAYAALENIFEDFHYEYAQDHGVYYDRNDDLNCFEVDLVLDELNDRMGNDLEDSMQEKTLYDFLSKWKGYTIWL